MSRRCAIPALRETLHRRLLDAPFDPALLERPRAARAARADVARRGTVARRGDGRRRARRAGRRRRRARPARTAARRSVDHRDHGERPRPRVHRTRRSHRSGGVRDRRRDDRAGRRARDRAARVAARPRVADGRRPARRRLAAARGAAPARARRSVPVDPPVRRGRGSARGVRRRAAHVDAFFERDGRAPAGTSSSRARRARARPRVATRWPARSIRPNGSSPSRRRPSCGSISRTSCASKRGPRTPKEPARSVCASSCAARCACARIGSSSARCAAVRRSTCSRRATPDTTVRSRPSTPNSPDDALARIETLALVCRRAAAVAGDPAAADVGDRRDRAGAARPRRPARDRRGRGARRRARRAHPALADPCRRPARRVRGAVAARPAHRDRSRHGSGTRAHPDRRGRRQWPCASWFAQRGAPVRRRRSVAVAIARRTGRRVPVVVGRRVERALDAAAIDVQRGTGALDVDRGRSPSRRCSGSGSADRRSRSAARSSSRVGVPVGGVDDARTPRRARSRPRYPRRSSGWRRSCGRAEPIATAIGAVAAGDGPLAPDMARVDTRVRLGASIAEALARVVEGARGRRGRRVGGRARAVLVRRRSVRRRARRSGHVAARPARGRGRGPRVVVAGADVGVRRRRRAGRVHRVVGRGRSARTARAHRHRCSGGSASSLGLGAGRRSAAWWMRSIVRSGSRS